MDEWIILVFSDADWAGDQDTRKSISGYMIFICGVLVCWRSKAQSCVALSSSESEWYALSKAVKEVPYLVQVMMFLGVKVKLPVTVKVDNMGAVYMSENQASSQRTRHMDTRHKYIVSLQEQGLIKVEFVRSEENTSDICTKNVTVDLYEKHITSILTNKEDMEWSKQGGCYRPFVTFIWTS